MGIFDMFTSNTAAPAQQQQSVDNAGNPGNLPDTNPNDATLQNTSTAPNGVVPDNAQNEQDQPEKNSPLDQFSNLWEPVENKDGNETPAALDSAKLQEVISKADFSSALSPENLAKIAAGGEEATTAFAESMNSVAQQVLFQATLAANKMTEQAVEQAMAKQASSIPEILKKQMLSNTLADSNPVYSNPAIKPVLEAVTSQLAAKHPNATPIELAEMAQNFVSVMGEALAPKPPAGTNNQTQQEDFDWSKFLTP